MHIGRHLVPTNDERSRRGPDGRFELSPDTLQELMAEEAAIIAIRRSVQKAARNARRSN
jgi:hypothetical protein